MLNAKTKIRISRNRRRRQLWRNKANRAGDKAVIALLRSKAVGYIETHEGYGLACWSSVLVDLPKQWEPNPLYFGDMTWKPEPVRFATMHFGRVLPTFLHLTPKVIYDCQEARRKSVQALAS
jgi:hypothetical protein